MNKNFFYLLISGITGVSVAVAIISNVGVDVLRFRALRADLNPFLLTLDNTHAAVTNPDFDEVTVDWGDSSKTTTQIYYSSAKRLDNGLCVLANGATIQKAKNAPSKSLSAFEASGTGALEIKTSFDGNYTNEPYVYNYTLGQGQIDIVGNYFKITAVNGEAKIISIHISYDCNTEDSKNSGVTYRNMDKYVYFTKLAHENWVENFLNVKLHSDTTLTKNSITMRNSDNKDTFAIECADLVDEGNGDYDAKFSLTTLNTRNGTWAQYIYIPRIYVNNKRVDGTENGNIHATGTFTTDPTINNMESDDVYSKSANAAYKLEDRGWGISVSWINNIEDSDVQTPTTKKGLHFTRLGSGGTASYAPLFSTIEGQNTYLTIYTWTESEQEADVFASNWYQHFTLKKKSGWAGDVDFSTTATEATKEVADDGYKVGLKFEVSALRGHGYNVDHSSSCGITSGQSKWGGAIPVDLFFNGLPYLLRGNGNTGLLKITYTALNNNCDIQVGHDWYWTHLTGNSGWVWLEAKHA